jgi:phospho-N-acetylmuramoyl-pentapeptide-transferase
MGGLLLIPALLISLLAWGNYDNVYVRLGFLGALGFCMIGFVDDYIKLRYPDRRGLTSMAKLVLQTMVSGALAFALWKVMRAAGDAQLLSVAIPFTSASIDLSALGGMPFLLLCTVIMVGTSNGVNLTDGMDGLAPGCVLICSATFALIAYIVGRHDYAEYLSVLYVAGAQEMVIFTSALAGAALAFLWFNAYPAQVFLGDTGSLPLGGLLGYVAIVSKQELLLPIVGGIFVIETLSVVLQVGSFKLRGKRIFRIAPIHHHFQFGGMPEPKSVVRFWIVGGVFAMLGLASLRFG